MKAPAFLLITCLLGSLSELQVSASEDEAGDSRMDVFAKGPDGQPGDRLPVKPGLIDNIKHDRIWNWLYVYLDETTVAGFSVRLSDQVMLTPKGIKPGLLRMTAASNLPDFFDVKEARRLKLDWHQKPKEVMKECAVNAWLLIERFQNNPFAVQPRNPKDSVTVKAFESDILQIAVEDMPVLPGSLCKVFSYRNIGPNIVTFSDMRVRMACNKYGPLCTMSAADSLKADNNTSYLFCPEDNGAPIICAGALFAIVSTGENTKCLGEVLVSRVNKIKGQLEEIFKDVGDHPRIFREPVTG